MLQKGQMSARYRAELANNSLFSIFQVPSLEHNGKATGESLDLLEYLENNFEGPKLFPTVLQVMVQLTELTLQGWT